MKKISGITQFELQDSSAFVVAASLCRGALRITDAVSQHRRGCGPTATRRWVILFAFTVAFVLAPAAPSMFAQQYDDHNPVGVTGAFGGSIETACSYGALDHSAHRAIDDIVVPGSIGKYPLKMTRYYNSRSSDANAGLGPGWQHQYSWLLTVAGSKVVSPSGAVYDFHCDVPRGVSESWDDGIPAPHANGGTWRLADGGKVHFTSSLAIDYIDDPHGQRTEITRTVVANVNVIDKVIEPGGRYLQFYYRDTDILYGVQIPLLTTVEAHGLGNATVTDSVNYSYTPVPSGGNGPTRKMLTGVVYSDNTAASYTYQQDNVPDNQRLGSWKYTPLLFTCNDVRYKGPMRQIAYQYQSPGPHGAILSERYSANGPTVSSISPGLPTPTDGYPTFPEQLTEARGDGPSRTFTYTPLQLQRDFETNRCPDYTGPSRSQFLLSYTDFQNHTTWLGYDGNWYIKSVTDARGSGPGDPNYTTTYTHGPAPPQGIGQITQINHPSGYFIKYDYEHPTPQNPDPHYVTRITYETGNVTKYFRDIKHRIYRTEYRNPGANDSGALLAYEQFAYCDQVDDQCSTFPLGQIKTHLLKNGAYVHYAYDSRGLLTDKWEPTWTSTADYSEARTHYDYYTFGPWTDRVQTVTLPANASGLQATETYEYDKDVAGNRVAGRGLITKTTHGDRKYQQFKYDSFGNKLWEDNELRNATSYAYDEYNRLLNVTKPLNGVTNYTYNPTNGGGSRLSHTTSNPDTITVRTGNQTSITTRNVYDANFRKTSSTAADGSPSTATTWFHYDPVGNQDWVTDPRGTVGRTYPNGDAAYTTYTDYDNRNRKWRVREPLGRTTQFYYDDGVNNTRIIRADQTTETKAYDGMNRVLSDTVPKEPGVNIITQFQYYPSNVHSASLLWTVKDGENHTTTFEYDPAGSKTKMTYDNSSYRTWAYDNAHNLKSRTTVAGEIQNFGYDNRNRKIREWWDGWPADGEWRAFDYDDAGHLTLATNGSGTYWTNFIADVRRSYDDAGRLAGDQQTVYVNGVPNTKVVIYPGYYDDGSLYRMYVDGVSGYDYTFGYDDMRRLQLIFPYQNPNALFQYSYDLASNQTQRYNWSNRVAQNYTSDQLNRITSVEVENINAPPTRLGIETYDYYPIGRLHTVTREDNTQDQFDYFLDGELKQARYGANPTPPPSPTPPATPTPPPGQVATPTCSPDGASYSACANAYTFNVMISTTTSGARIRWTTDGNNWTDMANQGIAAFSVSAGQTKTLQAYAYKSGMTNSDVHRADFSFDRECGGGPMAPQTAVSAIYPLDIVSYPSSQGLMAPAISTVTYSLDKAGNRTGVNGTSYSPNSINQYTLVGGSPVTNGNEHEIQVYAGLTYTYMRDQELIRVATTTPGLTYDLAYDALGRCVKRAINGDPTYYIYDGDKPILEYRSNGQIVRNLYGKGSDEILMRYDPAVNGGQWFFYQQDHEGSVTHLTNWNNYNGQIIERYRYDAFGTPTIYAPNWTQRTTSSYNNRFLFTGREYAGAWVYEYRARIYHSYLGRFMSEDPKVFDAGDYNLFRYCHNDAIDNVDPMGTQDERQDPWYTHAQQAQAIDITIAERISLWQKSMETGIGGEQALLTLQSLGEISKLKMGNPEASQLRPIDPSHPRTMKEFIIAGNMIEHGNTMDTTPAIDPIALASGTLAARIAVAGVTELAATRAMWVGRDGELAARASGAQVLTPSKAAFTAAKAGDWSLMRAESSAWAEGARGEVPVFFGNGKGRIFLNDELPKLLNNMNSGKVDVINITF